MSARRFTAFISYRHADNMQEGRRWAEWLHRALERYTVPPDLIGTPNLRDESIRDSLYPIFRDEDELPANADLATGIRAALEVSDYLIVICSPRSAVSPWVRKEVREFKELGRSDRILAIIIAGEPNADDPAKAREGIMCDEECFCQELRFGAAREDGALDWTVRTEPLAADLRPAGTRAEGFITAEAYREYLTLNSSLQSEKIAARVEDYRKKLDHTLLKVSAGLLGVSLGQLIDRDAAHRAYLAEKEAEKQRQIAEYERQLAEEAQKAQALANERLHFAVSLMEAVRGPALLRQLLLRKIQLRVEARANSPSYFTTHAGYNYDGEAKANLAVVEALLTGEGRWHPSSSAHIVSTGADGGYMEVYKFECCGKIVLRDNYDPPPQFSMDGCQAIALFKVEPIRIDGWFADSLAHDVRDLIGQVYVADEPMYNTWRRVRCLDEFLTLLTVHADVNVIGQEHEDKLNSVHYRNLFDLDQALRTSLENPVSDVWRAAAWQREAGEIQERIFGKFSVHPR